jgi:uncharacterized membrane protein YedE/YeeE
VVLYASVSGALFGFGLVLSGMANPAKVIGFLDITGEWDPSLALVMIGALTLTMPAFRYFRQADSCAIGHPHQIPTNKVVDAPLLVGSGLFGIGWGLVGLCPGPALVGLLTFEMESLVFVIAMLAGMKLFDFHRLLKSLT